MRQPLRGIHRDRIAIHGVHDGAILAIVREPVLRGRQAQFAGDLDQRVMVLHSTDSR